MKRTTILLTTLLWTCSSLMIAQEKFPAKWAAEFSISPDKLKSYSPDGSLVLGSNEKEICVLNGDDGKVLWSYKFKDKLGSKSFEYQSWNQEAGVILLFENSDDKCQKVFLDEKTGNELWRTDRLTHFGDYWINRSFRSNYVLELNAAPFFDGKKIEMIELRTGKVLWTNSQFSDFKDSDFELSKLAEEGLIGITNADKSGFIDIKTGQSVASGKTESRQNVETIVVEGKDLRIVLDHGESALLSNTRTMKLSARKISTGEKLWETSFEGTVIPSWGTPVNGIMVWGSGGLAISFDVVGDKAIVIYEGISVFDLSDGRKLWSAEYEGIDYSAGLKATQTLNVAARLTADDGIYVVDRKSEKIHKYELATGKELWSPSEISSDDIVPHMILKNQTLLAQFGGYLSVQSFFPQTNVYRSEFKFAGDSYGIRAYNAATGALLWNTDKMRDVLKEKFGDRITDLIIDGDYIYVCGEKTLCALDAQTGKPKYVVNVKDLGIGSPFALSLSASDQRLYLDCDEGIAAFNKADGSKIYSTDTDKNLGRFSRGKNYFAWVGEEPVELTTFIGFDLSTGAIKGKYEMNSSKPELTDDGEYLFRFDDEDVTKFFINKK